jgi:hypothetical protein
MNATNVRHAPYRATIAEGLRLAGLPE